MVNKVLGRNEHEEATPEDFKKKIMMVVLTKEMPKRHQNQGFSIKGLTF